MSDETICDYAVTSRYNHEGLSLSELDYQEKDLRIVIQGERLHE